MEKAYFSNKIFKTSLIVVLGILSFWNLCLLLLWKEPITLFTIIMQVTILLLIIKESKYAKLGIKIWSLILITGSALSFLGKSIKFFVGDNSINSFKGLFIEFLLLIIGILIYYYANKTIKIKTS